MLVRDTEHKKTGKVLEKEGRGRKKGKKRREKKEKEGKERREYDEAKV